MLTSFTRGEQDGLRHSTFGVKTLATMLFQSVSSMSRHLSSCVCVYVFFFLILEQPPHTHTPLPPSPLVAQPACGYLHSVHGVHGWCMYTVALMGESWREAT